MVGSSLGQRRLGSRTFRRRVPAGAGSSAGGSLTCRVLGRGLVGLLSATPPPTARRRRPAGRRTPSPPSGPRSTAPRPRTAPKQRPRRPDRPAVSALHLRRPTLLVPREVARRPGRIKILVVRPLRPGRPHSGRGRDGRHRLHRLHPADRGSVRIVGCRALLACPRAARARSRLRPRVGRGSGPRSTQRSGLGTESPDAGSCRRPPRRHTVVGHRSPRRPIRPAR